MKKTTLAAFLAACLALSASAEQITVISVDSPVGLGASVTGMEAFDGSEESAVAFAAGTTTGGFDIVLAKPVLLGKITMSFAGAANFSWSAVKDDTEIELWSRSQNGTWDLSGNGIVADHLRFRADGAELESVSIREIGVYGEDSSERRYRILPEDIKGSLTTSFYYGAGNLFDGNIDTEWQAFSSFGFDDAEPAVKSHVRGARREWWRDWEDMWDPKVRAKLADGKRVRSIQIYWGEEATGSVEFYGLYDGTRKKIGAAEAQAGTWSEIASPYPNDVVDEIDIVPHSSWRSKKKAAIGELYFWGDGNWEGNDYEYPQSQGNDGSGGRFLFFGEAQRHDKKLSLEFSLRGQGSANPSVEINGQSLALRSAYLDEGGVERYRVDIPAPLASEGQTILWVRGIVGEWRYGRLRYSADDGSMAWTAESTELADGWKYLPSYTGDPKVFSYQKDEPGAQWRLYGAGSLEAKIDEAWTEPPYEEFADGKVYSSWPSTSSLRLSPAAAGLGELELFAVPLTAKTPSFKVLWPSNGESLSSFDTRIHSLVGFTTSPNQVVKVNGVTAQTEGNLFWLPLSRLSLQRRAISAITVELGTGENQVQRQRIAVAVDLDPLWRIGIDEETVQTTHETYTIAGQTFNADMLVFVGDKVLTPTQGSFSADLALAPGINSFPVRLVYAPTGAVLESFTATIVRYVDGILLDVEGEGTTTYVGSNSYTVRGTVISRNHARVTVNGRQAMVNGYDFRSTVSLKEGANTITVMADDRIHKATKTIQVYWLRGKPVLNLVSPTSGSWFSRAIKVKGSIADAAPDSLWINGLRYAATSGSFDFSIAAKAEGENRLKFIAQNRAGTYGAEQNVTVKVDNTAPAAFTVYANVSGWTSNNRPIISFATTDSYSGIRGYEYSVNDGTWYSASSPYQLAALPDGIDKISVRATDNAGNSSVASTLVYIDTTPPAAVQNLRAIPGSSDMSVVWGTTDTDIVRYHVTRSPAWPDGERILSAAEVSDAALTAGDVYSYTVWAEDRANNLGPQTTTKESITGLALVPISQAEATVVEYEHLKVIVPAADLPSNIVAVMIKETTSPTLEEIANFPIVSPIYSISTLGTSTNGNLQETSHTELDKEVLVVLDYDEANLPQGFPEANLGVYYFDTTWSRWFKVEKSAIDVEQKKIVFTTNHFTDFSVQPTMVTDLSPQQLKDIGHSPVKTETGAGAVTVSPQGGTAMTEVTDLILPGKNGFSLPIKRMYDTGTALADSPSLTLSASLSFNDIASLIDIAGIGIKLADQGVSGMVSSIVSKITEMVQKNGDYALATGVGWRLNFPYVMTTNSSVVVRLPSGGYYNINQMETSNNFWTSNPVSRTLDFRYHEGEDFHFRVAQVRNDITDPISALGGQLSIAAVAAINKVLFGGSGYGGMNLNVSLVASLIPGWSTVYSELWTKDGSYYVFDGNGRIVQMQDKTGLNTFTFHYNGLLLDYIADDLGRQIFFEYNTGAAGSVFVKPVITRIWTKGYQGQNQSSATRTVSLAYNWNAASEVGTFFNFLPTLTSTTDVQGRQYSYSYKQQKIITGGGSIKVNFVALVLDLCGYSAVSNALGISALTLSGNIEINLPYTISKVVAPGVGTTEVTVDAQDLSQFDFRPTDYFLGLIPTALKISYQILFRLQTDQLVVTSSTGEKKTVNYSYHWSSTSDNQYYVDHSTVDDGRQRVVNTFSSYHATRYRFISWDDYLIAVAQQLFQSESYTIRESYTLQSGSTSYDSADGHVLETVVNSWDAPKHRLLAATTTRSGANSAESYQYDNWGNKIYQSAVATSNGQTERTETWSWYLNTSSSTPANWSVSTAFIADEALANGDVRDLLKGSVTRIYRPDTAGGGYEDTFRAFAYDAYAQKKAEGLWTGDHWATSAYEYHYDEGLAYRGALKRTIGPTGHATEYAYDYSQGSGGNFIVTKTEKSLLDADGNRKDIVSATAYDWNSGWKAMEFDGRGWITSYAYDKLGRVTDVKKPGDEAPLASIGWNLAYVNAPWERIAYDDQANTATLYRASYSAGSSAPNDRPYEKYYYDTLGQLIRIEKHNYHRVDETAKAMVDAAIETTTTTATYSPWGDVTSITDPNNHRTSYQYEARGRLVLTTYADGSSVSVSYSDTESFRTTRNERGVRTKEWLDWNEQTQRKIEDVNDLAIESFVYYDGAGRVAATVDPLGQTTVTWYNPWGKPRAIQQPALDSYQSPASEAEASAGAHSAQRIVPRVEYEFDDAGATIVERRGSTGLWHITTFVYDGLARAIQEQSEGRDVWRWYDASSKVIAEGPVGKDESGIERRYLTTTSYTSRGQIASQTDPAGATTTYAYDLLDRKIRMTDPRNFSIAFHYDDPGRLVLADLPPVEGATIPHIIVAYDARGNAVKRIDPLNKKTEWLYDERNRKIAEIASAEGAESIAKAYGYDLAGNPVLEIETPSLNRSSPSASPGIGLERSFDGLNRVTVQRAADGQETNNEYDALGRVSKTWDAANDTTTFTYNSLNKVATMIDPANSKTEYAYDAWGNQTAATMPGSGQGSANQYWVRGYNAWNQLTYEKNNQDQTWTRTYDKVRGLESESLDPRGTKAQNEYSPTGLLVRKTLTKGSDVETKTYSYDAAGALMSARDGSVTSTLNSATGSYVPNPYDLVTSRMTSLGGTSLTTAYSYDLERRPTRIRYPSGRTIENSYNAMGELTAIPGYAANGTYDYRGRLLRLDAANGTARSKTWNGQTGTLDAYTWNNSGKATRSLSWNNEGELISQTRDEGTSSYVYDELGRLWYADEALRVEVKADQDLDWGNADADVGGRRPLAPNPDTIKLDYHAQSIGLDLGTLAPVNRIRILKPNDRLTSKTVELYASPDNTTWTLVTDWIWNKKPDTIELLLASPVEARYFKLHCTWDERDPNNTAIDKSAISGRAYELIELWYTHDGQQSTYSYDALGNRLSTSKSIGPNYEYLGYEYYTPSNRIKYITQNGVIQWAYAYDGNGNLVTRAKGATDNGGTPDFSSATETWIYEYDLTNRLVGVKKGKTGPSSATLIAQYTYDYRDLRVQSVEDGKTVHYEYDPSGDLLYRSDGAETRDYIEALGQIWAEVRTVSGTSVKYWHHTDHLGTTELMTDASGKIVWEGGYEAFGAKVRENGSIDGSGMFTGKEYDEIVGLYYFNARWYDPELGRFITEDPARDGGNWFAYCGNSPLNFTDPDGNEVVTAVVGAGAAAVSGVVVYTWNFGRKVLQGQTPAEAIRSNNEELSAAGEAAVSLAKKAVATAESSLGNFISWVKGERKFKDNIKDKENNPDNWAKTGESTIPSTKTGNRDGGTSTETEWTNKETGDRIYEHQLKDKEGKTIEEPHYRPFPKQLKPPEE
jgi:RHS repeat-associated protein